MTTFDPDAMVAPLAARAASLRSDSGAPAIVIEASRGGRSASTVLGVDDVGTGTPATSRQTFEIGSQTKMMTAVAVLQLADEGLIDLDAPASAYLPAATIAGIPNAATATVRQLLAMRSGVPNYMEARDADGTPLYLKALAEHPDRPFGPAEALEIARGMAATNAPGAAYHYGNTPYLLLGLMLEEVTNRSLAEILRERIFDPADMDDTTADRSTPIRSGSRATPAAPGSWWTSPTTSGSTAATPGSSPRPAT
jgi:D-alanyl-D-alanine carboxypeptidase